MKVTFTAVMVDLDLPPGPHSEGELKRYIDRALTHGDRHQNYFLYAKDIVSVEEGGDE